MYSVHKSLLSGISLGLLGAWAMIGAAPQDHPSPPKTPAQELATFEIEDGMKVELVAAEPLVEDPVIIAFDPDGRLWVVEMRGFMPDIDGEGETQPLGRIKVLQDKNDDGRMDVATVFLDKLILPRAIALVKGGVLVAENKSLWFAPDANGDLKADKKVLLDATYAQNGLPEHSDNGLWRGIDNWYYNAKSRLRYRFDKGQWLRDSTEFRGQWGISHDDEGRLIYNYNWSQLHADLVPPNYLSQNKNHIPTTGIDYGLTLDRRIYPIRSTPAVNRGYIPGTLDAQGRLLEFTAACSPLAYREKLFPTDYHGNIFVCEPAGNLIKRNATRRDSFLLSAFDPHPKKEFWASTDERFRPVHLTTGPDGALYVADMYRGLIQHGAYVTPYLREQTLKRNLVLPIHLGRIWRIVPKNWKPTAAPKLSKMPSAQLVTYLENPNGWYRDVAQRLLVERNDRQIVPLLVALLQNTTNDLARFHALWTLEGYQWQNKEMLLSLLNDPSHLVSNTALRLLETLAKKDRTLQKQLFHHLLAHFEHASPEQILQMTLSARVLAPTDAQLLLSKTIHRYGTSPLLRDAVLSSLTNQEFAFLTQLLASPDWNSPQTDKEIVIEMLTTAIVRKRDPQEMKGLLTLLDTKEAWHWWQKSILTALAVQGKNRKNKPTHLESAPAVLGRTDLDKLQSTRLQSAANLFEWEGHVPHQKTTTDQVPLSDDDQRLFALGRQHYLTTCAGCHGTDGAGLQRFGPPLVESAWVLGDEKRLSLIVLHGMEGPLEVNGKKYDVPDILPVMPSHSTMDDGAITAILVYIRNEWGNNAGGLSKGIVSKTRHTSQGRVVPWTAKELQGN